MKTLFFISLFLFVSCTHKTIQDIGVTDDLFPFGIYQQSINVEYFLDGKKQSGDFQAAIKKAKDELTMYAFAGFGISLFKIRDIKGKPLEFESTEPRILQRKDFFLRIFPLIKEILELKSDDSRLKNQPIVLHQGNIPVKVTFTDYKPLIMPNYISITDEKNFTFKIETKKFEIAKP